MIFDACGGILLPCCLAALQVYTVTGEYAHAEGRKSPVVDGRVLRDISGKEMRCPILLNPPEKAIIKTVVEAFGNVVELLMICAPSCTLFANGCPVLCAVCCRVLARAYAADCLSIRNAYALIMFLTDKLYLSFLVCTLHSISFLSGQRVCGLDLLRSHNQSFVCDVNGWSFVKSSFSYHDDCAQILRNLIVLNCYSSPRHVSSTPILCGRQPPPPPPSLLSLSLAVRFLRPFLCYV